MEKMGSLPKAIGPYRVTCVLGRGGMGEVLQGHDDRLDRPVAIKRVLPDARDAVKALRRFRREAKTMARLSHPAIVQVHDWVEEYGQCWLVMELVEGQTLDELVENGPLSLRTVLEVGRDVATGLAAAHSAGIVHRDLKTSNVILTLGGQAKILDFGLAKTFFYQDAETEAAGIGAALQSTALTDEGRIVGTVKAMSPEQALGRKLDHRSDLFSLGVMLYEMTTGVAPFRGSNALETLAQICTQQEVPVGRFIAGVPAPFEDLIGSLLEKDPARRPGDASEVEVVIHRLLREVETEEADPELRMRGGLLESAYSPAPADASTASRITLEERRVTTSVPEDSSPLETSFSVLRWTTALLILGFALAVAISRNRGPAEPLYVAVTAVASGEGQEVDDARRLDRAAVKAGILRALLNIEGVVAIEPTLQDSLGVDQPVDQARSLGADELISSSLQCDPRACQVQLRRIRSSDGSVAWSGHLTFSEESLFEVSLGVTDQIRTAFPEMHLRTGLEVPRIKPADYRRFLELEERYLVRGSLGENEIDLEQAYDAIHASSPQLIELHQFAAGAWAQRFDETRQRVDLERARAAVAAGSRVAPEDPRILQAALGVHLVDGDLEAARSDVEALAAWEPGDANVLWLRARLLRAEGELESAYLLMRKAVARRPSWRYYSTLAVLARELGKLDEAQEHIDAMLARAPENFHSQSMAAEFELLAGNLERATELYERVVERRREPTELINLGTAYLLRGSFREAATLYEEVVRQMPDSIPALLNLADAESLLGETGAMERYRQVLVRIEEDPNPEALLANKAQALAHLGDTGGAIDAIQEALRHRPDDPATAFEAAVVYAVVGEEASALLHARRALHAGVNAVWFEAPWFHGIRDRLSQARDDELDSM